MLRLAVSAVALLSLTNCATIIEGPSQALTVNTVPPAANCRLDRDGKEIGTIAETPGITVVKPRTANDILVTCQKIGYQTTTLTNKSDTSGWVFGNILFGGAIGVVVDLITGSIYKYDSSVTLTLPAGSSAAPGGSPIRLQPVSGLPQS